MSVHHVNGPSPVISFPQQRRGDGALAPCVSVRVRRSGAWTILEVEGEMDIQALPLVADLSHGRVVGVVLELHGVTFMDASGLGMMVDVQRRTRDAGGCLRLAAPSSSVRRVLVLTGCDRAFRIFDSLLRAVSTPVDRADDGVITSRVAAVLQVGEDLPRDVDEPLVVGPGPRAQHGEGI